jgi:DNA-binding HxlR family transcriptional regulator
MSDAEKLIISAAVVTLFGLVVWLVKSEFNDLKKRLDEIAKNMVTDRLCSERHRAIEEKITAHGKSIRHLYRLANGEVVLTPPTNGEEE